MLLHIEQMYEERYIEASQKLVAEERLQRQRAESEHIVKHLSCSGRV